MKIKICGLKRKEDVRYVNQCKPDYIGFVFAGTKRRIDFETAQQLKKELNPDIQAIGVFVDEDIAFICSLVESGIIEGVQLHGNEDADYIERLSSSLGALRNHMENKHIPIIKAVRVQSKEQIIEADKLKVDFLLLDTFHEAQYGGSGITFNHLLIPKLTKQYILAGGIDLENVNEIVAKLKKENKMPMAIDVSSSVETAGIKDKDKIFKMVETVHKM